MRTEHYCNFARCSELRVSRFVTGCSATWLSKPSIPRTPTNSCLRWFSFDHHLVSRSAHCTPFTQIVTMKGLKKTLVGFPLCISSANKLAHSCRHLCSSGRARKTPILQNTRTPRRIAPPPRQLRLLLQLLPRLQIRASRFPNQPHL